MSDDPLSGLPRPPGDPAVSSGAAHKYSAAAQQLDSDSRQVLKVVQGLAGEDWIGSGSLSAVNCTAILGGAVSRAATAAQTSGSALSAFATSLTNAQSDWDRANRLGGEALSDESSYRATAEKAAQKVETQGTASGNIGAAHTAASIRSDAASYTSPLRSRAVSLATTARQDASTAGIKAAAALNEAAAMVPPPPPPPGTSSGDAGGDDDGLFTWFNNWVLGGGATAGAVLTLPPVAAAAGRWAVAANAARALPDDLQSLWDSSIGPLALAADRGELPWSAVAARADNFAGAATLFDGAAASRVSSARLSFLRGGLPDSGAIDLASKGLGVFGIVGDAGVMIDPGGSSVAEDTVNRVAAGGNAIATLVVINAAADEIPVAGEVVMVGTGLYLAGDWLYNNWQPFHNTINDIGSGISTGVTDTGKVLASGYKTATHVVHDVEPWHW